MLTLKWSKIKLLSEWEKLDIIEVLMKNRWIWSNLQSFFNPDFSDLNDPFSLDWIKEATLRIIQAKEKGERVVIFWDYDVDWVSSTAMLVRFFTEIWIEISYRLPHRINDWYWLKKHFIDDILEKNVKLLITVDCGTRDIEVTHYATSKWIDVIITDHHAVPEIIPTNLIALVNPKLKDSNYENKNLSWSGVAFKLLHAVSLNIFWEHWTNKILKKYIDFAMLWTIADCMLLTWENRTIAYLWLKQLKYSQSHWLKRLIEWSDPENLDSDIIWFKVWPRLNAAWRMDTPYKALKVLLAWEKNLDEAMEEIENLNNKRKLSTEKFIKKAFEFIDSDKNVIFFDSTEIEHWIIWLIAWRLCEAYNKVAIVLKDEWDRLVASCRSPEHISIIKSLEEFKEMFLFFWWHDGAAWFTILKENFEKFKEEIEKSLEHLYCENVIPKSIEVDAYINLSQIDFELINKIEQIRPFWYWNPKPLFLLKDFDWSYVDYLWKDQKHLKFSTPYKNISIKAFWFWEHFEKIKNKWIISLVIELERNVWNWIESISLNTKDIIL